MHSILRILLHQWLRFLNLPKHSQPWYRNILQGELKELEEAKTPLEKLSETSDVLFCLSRAQYDGFPPDSLPVVDSYPPYLVYIYMIAKFTMRWAFYRLAARICRGRNNNHPSIREVVNPRKDSKLEEVARRHGIDAKLFVRVAHGLRWVWPLPP